MNSSRSLWSSSDVTVAYSSCIQKWSCNHPHPLLMHLVLMWVEQKRDTPLEASVRRGLWSRRPSENPEIPTNGTVARSYLEKLWVPGAFTTFHIISNVKSKINIKKYYRFQNNWIWKKLLDAYLSKNLSEKSLQFNQMIQFIADFY